MEPDAPSGIERKRPRWRRRFAALLASGPILFGASNLVLNSPWSRQWVASKIQSRTTLETSIGGLWWSPWNGITIRDLQLRQPEPLRPMLASALIRSTRIRVALEWKGLLKRRIEIRSLTLRSPEIVLPIELVSHFAAPAPPAETPIPPVAMNTPPSPASSQETTLPSKPDLPPLAAHDPTRPPAAEPIPESPVTSPPAVPELPPPPPIPPTKPTSDPSAFIHLEDASFSLVLASASVQVLEFSQVNGTLPIQGPPEKSQLSVKTVRLAGNEIAGDLNLPLEWKSPFLTLVPFELKLAGLKSQAGGQLAMTAGFPIALECKSPDQGIAPITLPGNAIFRPQKVSSVLRFRGLLTQPSSWQADFINTAVKPVVTADGQETRFDQAQAVTLLRGGTLSCVDARMTGDDVSFLGNATILSNGKTAGVLRIVAPPETSLSIIRRLFPGVTAPPAFSSMSTPQRAALDIEVSGSLGDLDIRLGKNGPLIGHPTPPDSAQPK